MNAAPGGVNADASGTGNESARGPVYPSNMLTRLTRRSLLAFIVATLATAATVPPRPVVVAQQAAATAVRIPFELATRHVILQVKVNGSRPLSFVLDSGADVALVRLDVAKELGLALHGSVRTGGAGPGTQEGKLVNDATWSLVGFESFSQPLVFALPLEVLPSAMGRNIDGIIGGRFIRQFVLELDYEAKAITLHDTATFKYSGKGETLPLSFTGNGHPVVTATVTPAGGVPLERQFLLDIGSGQALALHSPFVAEQNLLKDPSSTIRSIGAAGAGGRTAGRLGRIDSLQIGSYKIEKPIVMFSEDKAGAFANVALAGNIGAQVTMRFRTFFDYGRRQISLEPSGAFGKPFDRAFSGVALRALGDDYRTFRVLEVLERSPATEAGIREGDIITAIDGKPPDALTLSAIHEMFERPVTYRVTLRRGRSTVTVTLTPRPLV